jgi:transposase
LAAKHGIHQTKVGEWKRQAMEGLTAAGRIQPKALSSDTITE